MLYLVIEKFPWNAVRCTFQERLTLNSYILCSRSNLNNHLKNAPITSGPISSVAIFTGTPKVGNITNQLRWSINTCKTSPKTNATLI